MEEAVQYVNLACRVKKDKDIKQLSLTYMALI